MEHFPLDIKKIKVSLNQITKYILNKSVERGKVNNFEDLKGIGKVAWEFISAIYDSGWDTLYVDNNTLFKNKVTLKFTPKVNNIPKNKGSKETEKLASVSSLSPPIPMKSPKKIKDIIKKNNNPKDKEMTRKLYTQVLLSGHSTREALKINEVFPNIQGKKIEKNINRGKKTKATSQHDHKSVMGRFGH